MHRPVDPDDDTGLPLQRSVRVIRRSSEMAMGAALIRVVPVPRPGDETDNTPSLFLVNLDVTRRSPLAIATSVRIEPDAGESTLRVTPHRHMFDVAWMRPWRTSEAHSASERVGASDERRATSDVRRAGARRSSSTPTEKVEEIGAVEREERRVRYLERRQLSVSVHDGFHRRVDGYVVDRTHAALAEMRCGRLELEPDACRRVGVIERVEQPAEGGRGVEIGEKERAAIGAHRSRLCDEILEGCGGTVRGAWRVRRVTTG